MRISVVANVLGLLGVFSIVAPIAGCGECPKDYAPCASKSFGDPCSQTCDGPAAYLCLADPPPDGPLQCVKGGPCNPADHCDPSPPCYSTTCDFTMRFQGPGEYSCKENNVCCKRTPVKAGSGCPASEAEADVASWTGVCDGAGVCEPPAGD